LCENTSDINPRDDIGIQTALASHEWEVVTGDKSPWGIISRFECIKCGDEYIVMLTSPLRHEKLSERSSGKLEVSAGNIILK
jgi:hypothetical protein